MKIFNYLRLLSAVFASVLVASCTLTDELDKLSEIESVQASGTFNANVLDETWTLDTLTKQTSASKEIKKNDQGVYEMGVENKDSQPVEKFKFPSIDINSIKDIPLNALNYLPEYTETEVGKTIMAPATLVDVELSTPKTTDNSTSPDFKLNEIKLINGAQIRLNVTNYSNTESGLIIKIPSITKNGVAYSKKFEGIQSSNTPQVLLIKDLDGYILAPNTENKITVSILPFIIKPLDPVRDFLKINMTIDIADNYSHMKGFFGELKIPMDELAFPVEMPSILGSMKNGVLTLKEALITATLDNEGFQFPIDLKLGSSMTCYYKGKDPIVKTITAVNSDASNVFKFKIKDLNIIDLDSMKLAPSVTINKGLTTGSNILTDKAKINFKLNMNVPLDIKADDLSFEKAIGNKLPNKNIEDYADVEIIGGKATLIGTIASEIPMGGKVQIYFKNKTTDNDENAGALFDEPFEFISGTKNFAITITKEKFDILKKYKYQIMKVTCNGDGAIRSDQTVRVRIGFSSKGTIKAKI